MSLIDFIGRTVKQISHKQSEALKEFADGILSIEIDHIDSHEEVEKQVSDNVSMLENQKIQNLLRAKEKSDEQIKNSQNTVFFFQKISNKNSRALDDFLSKLDQVTVQIPQNPLKNELQLKKPIEKTQTIEGLKKIPLNIKEKSVQYHKTIEVDTELNNFAPYNKSQQLYKRKDLNENPQKNFTLDKQKQKTASQILAQLDEFHKQRSIEKFSNNFSGSNKKRARIINMGSEMQDKLKEKKQKQAEQRIKINVEFLQSLKLKPSTQSPSFKEFKKSPMQSPEKLKQSIRIKILQKTTLMKSDDFYEEISTEQKKSYLGSSLQRSLNSSNISMESPLKLPQISQRKGALKPKPYSVYNLTQRGNEMFFNIANK